MNPFKATAAAMLLALCSNAQAAELQIDHVLTRSYDVEPGGRVDWPYYVTEDGRVWQDLQGPGEQLHVDSFDFEENNYSCVGKLEAPGQFTHVAGFIAGPTPQLSILATADERLFAESEDEHVWFTQQHTEERRAVNVPCLCDWSKEDEVLFASEQDPEFPEDGYLINLVTHQITAVSTVDIVYHSTIASILDGVMTDGTEHMLVPAPLLLEICSDWQPGDELAVRTERIPSRQEIAAIDKIEPGFAAEFEEELQGYLSEVGQPSWSEPYGQTIGLVINLTQMQSVLCWLPGV